MQSCSTLTGSSRTARSLLAGILLWSLASCASKLNVTTRYAADFNYKSIETFAFEPIELSLRPSWVDAQIKLDVQRVLISKGYAFEAESGGDLLVSFRIRRDQRESVRRSSRRRQDSSITFEEGSLTLEIHDSFAQRVYRGFARDVVAVNKQKTRRRLRRAVEQLLEDFPARE